MGWISALIAIASIAMLRAMLTGANAEEGWRGQVEGLRERRERRDALASARRSGRGRALAVAKGAH